MSLKYCWFLRTNLCSLYVSIIAGYHLSPSPENKRITTLNNFTCSTNFKVFEDSVNISSCYAMIDFFIIKKYYTKNSKINQGNPRFSCWKDNCNYFYQNQIERIIWGYALLKIAHCIRTNLCTLNSMNHRTVGNCWQVFGNSCIQKQM